jgi:uncharacterized membrane protein YesL
LNEEQVGSVIAELERSVVIDDPAFVRRFHNIRRNEWLHAVIVFVLLAVGAVLLAVTLATTAALHGGVALIALIGAVVADEVYERRCR